MSDHEHDHSHHHHGHDHDHDHDHGHEQGAPAGKPAPAPAPAPASNDDAGSQALAAALRSSFGIVKFVMVLLVLLFLGSGIFTVGPHERAIILRFGQPQGAGNQALLGAGLHFALPYPIDEVVRIPITEIQQVRSTVGWYATTPELEFNNTEPPPGASLNPAIDGYTITGDGNIIHTRATLSYRIEDPVRFAFDFVNASNAVQNALDNALLYASARFQVDDVLTRNKEGFRERVQARVEQLVQAEKLGIVVEQCTVESKPPRQLKAAFDAVLTALSTRDTVHNEAVKYENQVMSRAAAEAVSRTNTAQVESDRMVKQLKAETERFANLLPKYRQDPELTVSWLLNERIGQVMTNVDSYYLPERDDGKPRALWLQLSREPLRPATPTTVNP